MSEKDDSIIIRAVKAANSGHHLEAAHLYQDAGNQVRNPEEKEELWKAAERHREIHNSD